MLFTLTAQGGNSGRQLADGRGGAATPMTILANSVAASRRSPGTSRFLSTAATLLPAVWSSSWFRGLRDLPHFNPDISLNPYTPSVLRWRQALADSDAVLIASPEYGFSLPGVVKNAIDWVIGSGELEGKVVAITAAVPGPERGRRGLQALRDTLSAVRATIVGGEPIPLDSTFEQQVTALLVAVETARK